LLPYPFSRGVFICGEPVTVSNDAGPGELEAARARLEETLVDITAAADSHFKR
jgi:lysophospholipid acyltransferase (LPLAT)-like uncharacterized protein